MSWNTIESDPGVFTDLLDAIGTTGLEIEEVWGLDEETLSALQHRALGLLFLFRYGNDAPPPQAVNVGSSEAAIVVPDLDKVWFGKQVVNNACATQALLHVILNTDEAMNRFSLGPAISAFRDFSIALPPQERGIALGDCEPVRCAHNSFARAEPFADGPSRAAKKGDDVFHFIAFIPSSPPPFSGGSGGEGAIELDGLEGVPRYHGSSSGSSWLAAAGAALRARTSAAGSSELHFNLLAVVRDARVVALQRAGDAAVKIDSLDMTGSGLPSSIATAALIAAGFEATSARQQHVTTATPSSATGIASSSSLSEETQVIIALDEISQAGVSLASAIARRSLWAAENARRRHNFVPLLLALAQGLAKVGALRQLVTEGRAGTAAARERRKVEVEKREVEKRGRDDF